MVSELYTIGHQDFLLIADDFGSKEFQKAQAWSGIIFGSGIDKLEEDPRDAPPQRVAVVVRAVRFRLRLEHFPISRKSTCTAHSLWGTWTFSLAQETMNLLRQTVWGRTHNICSCCSICCKQSGANCEEYYKSEGSVFSIFKLWILTQGDPPYNWNQFVYSGD
jgi:hypothetical protein